MGYVDAGERLIQYFKTFRCNSFPDSPYTGYVYVVQSKRRRRGDHSKCQYASEYLSQLCTIGEVLDDKSISLWCTILQFKKELIDACQGL